MALAQYIHGSYFSIQSPVKLIDRWVHTFCHHRNVELNGKKLRVEWTERAERALSERCDPVIIEMQLYFSCVVKKLVLFHDQSELETTAVNDKLRIAFRAVQSAVCDPEEFARNYPVGRVLKSPAAAKMIPSKISIDFHKGHWQGEFGFGA